MVGIGSVIGGRAHHPFPDRPRTPSRSRSGAGQMSRCVTASPVGGYRSSSSQAAVSTCSGWSVPSFAQATV